MKNLKALLEILFEDAVTVNTLKNDYGFTAKQLKEMDIFIGEYPKVYNRILPYPGKDKNYDKFVVENAGALLVQYMVSIVD